jgi:hypothetical protein
MIKRSKVRNHIVFSPVPGASPIGSPFVGRRAKVFEEARVAEKRTTTGVAAATRLLPTQLSQRYRA